MERIGMHPKAYKAAKSGDIRSMMTIILENGEDIFHQTTPNGNNIIHIAAQYKQVSFIRDLLQHPSRSSLLLQGNYKGDTPVHVAAKTGSYEAVRFFIDQTKSVDQPDAYKELLRIPNRNKDTSLHYAIRGGQKGVVELLIEEDPQLCDITNAADESPLYLAAHRRDLDITVLILNAFSSSSSHKGPKGLTALHAAIHYSLLNWKEILEKRPEVIREGDDLGWTPLHYAAFFGNVKAVQLLLQHDTSVTYSLDKEGKSALHVAALRGHVHVIDELVKFCPDAFDMINAKGETALHSAVIGGQVTAVKHILSMPKLDYIINEEDADGNTALHLAVFHRNYMIVFILGRDRRVDRLATNKDHLTAQDIYFAGDEDGWLIRLVLSPLSRSQGLAFIQGWVMEQIKKSNAKQFFDGQPAGSPSPTGSNAVNGENSDSSITTLVDTQLLVAAFIATVTFTAAFTLPGGYGNDGMATLSHKAAFTAFVIFNTIAFCYSTSALILQYDTAFLSNSQKLRFAQNVGLGIHTAILAMMLAFASGTYVVLTRTIGLAVVPFAVIGFFVIAFIMDSSQQPHMYFLSKSIRTMLPPRSLDLDYEIRKGNRG